ncbi:MAG: 3-isopropylmalate dehydratase [Candidatus Aminicenantes bacterium]|nr:3-isopropylmalate dehydratase [Candidatus Aminicenantes bacterium]
MKNVIFSGHIWVLTDREGCLIEDIDTDQIYHNAYLHITERSQMGKYALGNLSGWEDFSRKVKPGDILAAGRNFGAGSSRQQAVDCFAALGVSLILAPSFGAIYFRNAVNSGFPVIRFPNLKDLVKSGSLITGEKIEIDLSSGKGSVRKRAIAFQIEPLREVQSAIYQAGSLFNYGRGIESNSDKKC